jgi:hypothetical protein
MENVPGGACGSAWPQASPLPFSIGSASFDVGLAEQKLILETVMRRRQCRIAKGCPGRRVSGGVEPGAGRGMLALLSVLALSGAAGLVRER